MAHEKEKSADRFADQKLPWIYEFPVDHSAKNIYGCPALVFCPQYQGTLIRRLWITYAQTPNHGETYMVDCGEGSECLLFLGWPQDSPPLMVYCPQHATLSVMVYLPESTSIRISVLRSSITVNLRYRKNRSDDDSDKEAKQCLEKK